MGVHIGIRSYLFTWLHQSNVFSMHVCGHAWHYVHSECAPLTMDIDLPEPRHFVSLSSRTAGLQERLQERLDERLGMGWGGPSLELCTASYRLSIDPSWCRVARQTGRQTDSRQIVRETGRQTGAQLLDSWNLEAGVIYEWISSHHDGGLTLMRACDEAHRVHKSSRFGVFIEFHRNFRLYSDCSVKPLSPAFQELKK